MADQADIAADLAEAAREAAIERHAERLRPPVRVWCVDCGEPIDMARRQALGDAGVIRCIDCQRIAERRW
ncbi:MAG: TraR/DksA C4-type zinc finger protein [Zavarzinia sp.]|nr:TraR/DksA C4-type zinc finger protein [Zavarzinia sp.]